MKKIILILLFFSAVVSANAQTYIKTNALYWLGLLPNAQVETKLANNFTFQGEVNASLWDKIDNSIPMMGAQFIVGGRWYPKQAFKGFYAGADFGFDIYKVSKWDHWNKPDGSIDVQRGIGYYLGITLGYQMPIAKRWNMDFYAGGGWHLGKYWGENIKTDGSSSVYATWNASGEWIPYKLGVTFAYRLTSEKRMVKRYGENYSRYERRRNK